MQKSLCLVTLLCAATSACPDVNLGNNTRYDGGGNGGIFATGGSAVMPGTGGRGTGGASVAPGTGGASVAPGTGGATTVADAALVTGGQVGSDGASGGAGGSAPITLPLVTSAASAFWRTDDTWIEVTGATADVTVDDTAPAQSWEGFGGCFNEMGWSYLATPALQSEAVSLLYGADGCHFALGRIPIGSSDYAMDRYTLDETPGDTALSDFSIARDKQRLIPFIKAAQQVKPDIRFWANPWTPPTWMKNPPFAAGGTSAFDGGSMKDDDAILKAYAQYFVKFIQAYGQEGIPVDVVAPQNEPNYTQSYPSCTWTAPLYTKFIGAYLGPALAGAGLTTKIMLGTLSNPASGKDPALVTSVMGDSLARPFIGVLGFGYGMTVNIAAAVASYGLPVWVGEHKAGNYPWNPAGSPPYVSAAAPNDLAYGVETWNEIKTAIKAGASGYNAWNMVLDPVGKGLDSQRDWAQNALLVADGNKLTKTPAFYVFRHFSQFVAVGARVLPTQGGDAVGFRNPDGTLIVVIYNAGAARTTTVAVAGKQLQLAMPASGWATLSYKP